MAFILLIDDEPNLLYSLEVGLASEEFGILTAQTGKQGIQLVGSQHPDVVVLDLRLPDMMGLEVFEQIRQIDPKLPVIIITAFATTETAIEATKRGAFDYLLKPVDLHRLREVVEKALQLRRLTDIPANLPDEKVHEAIAEQMIGQSPIMHEVYKAIGRVASQDVSVLILGESGTGKELIARAIYQHSHRSDQPFLTMNCAAIPETLLESELFGHEKGAFTGADRQRIGKFEQADRGTLFLDEIGDMSPTTQAKILRLLQDQSFERLGGSETIQTHVRVIAATNRNLEQMVQEGSFRQDLFYRLNGFTISLPPLRDRKEDIPLLTNYFLKLANQQLKKNIRAVSSETMHLLEQHSWPGNIRELQSVIRYAVLHAISDIITPDCLPPTIHSPNPPFSPESEMGEFNLVKLINELLHANEEDIYRRIIHEVDAIILKTVLDFVRGNQVHASEILGISRTTLRSKLAQIDNQLTALSQ
jgi:nitrogen regulation protein NR(I)